MKIEGNRPTHEAEALTRTDAQKGQKPATNRAAVTGDRVEVSADAEKAQGLVADGFITYRSYEELRAATR